MNNLGLVWPTVGGVNLPWLLKFSVGAVGGKLMRYLCYSILAGCIIIRCCRAWRDVGLPSESGNRVVVNAEPETRAECTSSFHVSTGRTLVLTIRPWGPMFVFTAFRYCSAAQFNLGGICKQYRKACCVVCTCVYGWASAGLLCVCVCLRVLVTPHWSMGPYTELLISEGNQTFLKLLSSGFFFALILWA